VAHIATTDAVAWFKGTEVSWNLSDTDAVSQEDQIATQVLAQLAVIYDVSGWTNELTTPKLVRSIMAMYLVAWWYDRAYSQSDDRNPYAFQLIQMADRLLAGIITGQMVLTDVDQPDVFVTQEPSIAEELINNDPVFTMGKVF
jgi:hypothetical protein